MKQEKLKIYECAKDGLPDIGRPFIAFRKTHEEHEIYTRCDKDKILAQNWDDVKGHISPDGEFYSGAHHWIYHVDYESYVYVDELNLVPQSHFDKVAKEEKEAAEKLAKIKAELIKEYGEEDGTKLQKFILIEKDNRRVSLYSYYEHLLKPFDYTHDMTGMLEGIAKKFDKDFAKKIVNHKILKEGVIQRCRFDIERIKLKKNFIIDDSWQRILLYDNAKGVVKDNYLYVARVLRKERLDTSDIRSWLSSKNLLGENKYFKNEGAEWEYANEGQDWNILFNNILID